VLHCQEGHAVGLLDRVDGDDVGMVESGQRFGFTPEASDACHVASRLWREQLERHAPVQPQVLGGPHVPHPASAQLPEDPVVPQHLAGLHR
jgi:hypothetical protein